MFQVSWYNPPSYLTSVAHNRHRIFQKDAVKQRACDAFNDARNSGGMLIFADVITPDHSYVITNNKREVENVLRYINGLSAKRLIDHLGTNGYKSSLAKLRT